eukprot:4482651-Amphidinium_carterae.1
MLRFSSECNHFFVGLDRQNSVGLVKTAHAFFAYLANRAEWASSNTVRQCCYPSGSTFHQLVLQKPALNVVALLSAVCPVCKNLIQCLS